MNSIRFIGVGQISQTIILQKGLGFGFPSSNVNPKQLQAMGNAKDENLT